MNVLEFDCSLILQGNIHPSKMKPISSNCKKSFLFICLMIVTPLCSSNNGPSSASDGKKVDDQIKSDPMYFPKLPKDVVVIGGGIAGLAAARTLTADRSNFTVRVYEAQKTRYGGRIWTDKLTNMNAKGPEVDLGGAMLNIVSKDNPLIDLAESFDLKLTSIETMEFIVPWEGQRYSGEEVASITKTAVEVLSHALNQSKSLEVEVSVKEAVNNILKDGKVTDENSPGAYFVKCLPSYIINDYTTKNYRAGDLDMGYDKVLLDGMGELLDRLVSGSMDQPPLHVVLNKAVRQIKVDDHRDKVLVRFQDGSQVEADIVVVAVPVSIIASSGLLFEPELPPKYKLAANEITVHKSNKVILEFEHAFWPPNVGVFIRAVKDDKERGKMQTWLNIHKIINRPFLAAFFLEEPAAELEKMTDDEVKSSALSVLAEMFGQETVDKGGKIVNMQRSHWVSDEFSKGASTHTGVGADLKMWDTFSEPLCPFVYFAGEYTTSEGLGSIHGAYNSGLRVGNQILSGLCDIRMEEARRREEEEKKKQDAKDKKPGDSEDDKAEKEQEENKDEL